MKALRAHLHIDNIDAMVNTKTMINKYCIVHQLFKIIIISENILYVGNIEKYSTVQSRKNFGKKLKASFFNTNFVLDVYFMIESVAC